MFARELKSGAVKEGRKTHMHADELPLVKLQPDGAVGEKEEGE